MGGMKDRFLGCMLGIGIGDAMGYPVETLSPEQIRACWGGPVMNYRQRKNRPDRPPGSVTDDTQMSLCVAESLVESHGLSPADAARRFVGFLDYAVGIGSTVRSALMRMEKGTPWQSAGINSAGNGAAMRAAPIGLFYHRDRPGMMRACRDLSLITHTDSRAIAGAVAVAGGVAMALHSGTRMNPRIFANNLAKLTKPVSREFAERIAWLPSLMKMDAMAALDRIRTGAFVMESVPAAIYVFMRFHDSFENSIRVAVNAGFDADSVASMAGAIAGARLGAQAIPETWRTGLQHGARTKLERAAENLWRLAA